MALGTLPSSVLVSYGFASAAAGAPARSPETLAQLGRLMAEAGAHLAAVAGDRDRRAETFDVVESRAADPDHCAEDLAALVALVAGGSLVPQTVAVPLDDVAKAHADLDAGRPVGRLVLDHTSATGDDR